MADAYLHRILETGELPFTIESRLIRELGERLVRQPEVALLELVKNAYDADARSCEIRLLGNHAIEIVDDGTGMTLDDFAGGWMRIGTSSKGKRALTQRYGRPITGEKGIGRFAVRYLGQSLDLVSTAFDPDRKLTTRLEATFEWEEFDRQEDLNGIKVPYRLIEVGPETPTGTSLSIGDLKPAVREVDWKALLTASMGVVSPVRSLLKSDEGLRPRGYDEDPGFQLSSVSGGRSLTSPTRS
jgi:hypothetical protein